MLEWDAAKNRSNVAKHGLDFADAELVFASDTMTFADHRQDYGEPRFVSFGWLHERFVVIAHTRRADKIRIISMRKGNRREQKAFEKRLKETRRPG